MAGLLTRRFRSSLFFFFFFKIFWGCFIAFILIGQLGHDGKYDERDQDLIHEQDVSVNVMVKCNTFFVIHLC